jgi:hypothetical protein
MEHQPAQDDDPAQTDDYPPSFAEYLRKTSRRIPIVALVPRVSDIV